MKMFNNPVTYTNGTTDRADGTKIHGKFGAKNRENFAIKLE